MNRILGGFTLLFLVVAFSCNSSSTRGANPADIEKDSANFTRVQWSDSVQDFGSVVKGQKVHLQYHCKNVGDKPMYIVFVKPGCGCTVANYTENAIPPGGTGVVNAEYDSDHGIIGHVTKTISVRTNSINGSRLLVFSGNVTRPPDEPKKSS